MAVTPNGPGAGMFTRLWPTPFVIFWSSAGFQRKKAITQKPRSGSITCPWSFLLDGPWATASSTWAFMTSWPGLCRRWATISRSSGRKRMMPLSATEALVAWPPVLWIRWQPWAFLHTGMASVMSTGCFINGLWTDSRWSDRTTGCVTVLPGSTRDPRISIR